MSYEVNKNRFYLCHWGVKGQQWGVRRYRNPDGTLTDEGKARLHKTSTKAKAAGVLGGIAGGIIGGVMTPTMVQRGVEFADATIGLPALEGKKYLLYRPGSEAAMRILGAIGGIRLGYKIASNTTLRKQGYSPKQYKRDMEEERYGI